MNVPEKRRSGPRQGRRRYRKTRLVAEGVGFSVRRTTRRLNEPTCREIFGYLETETARILAQAKNIDGVAEFVTEVYVAGVCDAIERARVITALERNWCAS